VALPASVPATTTATGRWPTASNAAAYPSPAVLAAVAAASPPGTVNPEIAAIQSRVAELVRRYDDAVADAEEQDEEQDDDGGFGVPARWRVGDVLLATHSALAHTSSRVERAMMVEFADDPEVSAAMGSRSHQVGDAMAEAERQAERRHKRLSHIQQALHSATATGGVGYQPEDDSEKEESGEQKPTLSQRERQLKSTVDALHREKTAVAAQLQEALRLQREASVANEQQAQELAKAQKTVRSQAEELRLAQEGSDKAAEAALASAASWRDKFKASAKAAETAEAKVEELEAKLRAQSEELVKREFVLQAKMQEAERHKESEAARHRAEAEVAAQALADAEAEARKAKAKLLEERRNAAKGSADGSNKELQAMESKLRELQRVLQGAESAKKELEAENAELSQRVRELQTRLSAPRRPKPTYSEDAKVEAAPVKAPVSSFALRLREDSPRVEARKRPRGMTVSLSATRSVPEVAAAKAEDEVDDLSSDGETEDGEAEGGEAEDGDKEDEVVRDERELNRAMQLVVATVFPPHSLSKQSDASLVEHIAKYEDPSRSPLNELRPTPRAAAKAAKTGEMVPRSELEKLRRESEQELDALRQQYVDGLLEYKRLVIEQYDRRQANERERHRLEVEGLLALVQTKFHAELARRSERLKRTKEALKVLYHALRQRGESATEPQTRDGGSESPRPALPPLKTLLRAAILAMSSSARRNRRGTQQIAAIHEQLTTPRPRADSRTSALAAAMAIHSAIQDEQPLKQHAETQTDVVEAPRADASSGGGQDREGSRGRGRAPLVAESLEGYVLPGSSCFSSRSAPQQPPQSPPELATTTTTLLLAVGMPLSEALVAELRRLLPGLPPGCYYLSAPLRLALFRELVRYYAAPETRPLRGDDGEAEDQLQEAETVLGSPRDTPFLRRKALEALESSARRRNRRQLFASGGVAIMTSLVSSQAPSISRRGRSTGRRQPRALEPSMYANNVSNLDQILSSLQCYPRMTRPHNDGTTSTLLNLEGTIPIFYRGNQYNIPVEFWVVETYPMAPPVCFVRPTADMMVKPGHPHVTSDGYVKIPYTTDWRPDFTLLELVAHMCSIFGNMPPVFRRPANSMPSPYPTRLNGSGSAAGGGTGGYFQQGQYAQMHPPQPSPYYSAQFQSHPRGAESTSSSLGPNDADSLFGSSQHSLGSASASGAFASGRSATPEDRATTLKAEVTGQIQMQLEKTFKRVRDDIDLQFEHEVQLTQSRENVERGLQSLRFLRDDIARAREVVASQDEEVTVWLEENEGKDTVDPDTILIEGDALSKQYVVLCWLVKTLAEHHAIEDALYYMDRALSNDEIELSSFLKEVRKLARQQFMCQALVQKVRAKQQELALPSYHSSPRS
ncbi:hypothetical protein BBJ28_00017182, partial [Nothophytophthora sp. Chile5]